MYKAKINNQDEYSVDLTDEGLGAVNGVPIKADIRQLHKDIYQLEKDGKTYTVEIVKRNLSEKTYVLKINGKRAVVALKSKTDEMLLALGFDLSAKKSVKEVKAPMPGLVLSISCEIGTEVKIGDPLLILEAMKMENVIKSPGEGKVKRVVASEGSAVEKNQILIQFE